MVPGLVPGSTNVLRRTNERRDDGSRGASEQFAFAVLRFAVCSFQQFDFLIFKFSYLRFSVVNFDDASSSSIENTHNAVAA